MILPVRGGNRVEAGAAPVRLGLPEPKNCAYEDLERLLLAVGFTIRKTAGSHRVFKHGIHTLTVPERRPLRENYVDAALAIIDSMYA